MDHFSSARHFRWRELCKGLTALAGVLSVVVNVLLPWAIAAVPAGAAGTMAVLVCTPHGLEFRVVPGEGPTNRGEGGPSCPLCPGPMSHAAVGPLPVIGSTDIRYIVVAVPPRGALADAGARFDGIHPVRAPPSLLV